MGRGGPRWARSPLFPWNCVLFLQNSQKNRKYLNGLQVGKCPGHAFLNFLDPPLKVKERLRKVTSY